ncbi:MAG: hypothetical protein HY040_02385 [Planctomycetes bacterium]|nr:hypothetical protein [Planctomycetota bacterium]
MCTHFFTAGGVQKNFKKGSNVSNEAKSDVGFLNFVSTVRFGLDRAIRTAWKAGSVDDRAIALEMRKTMDSPKFGTGQFSGALAAFIGGFQGYHVEMCRLTADTAAETFTYSLDVEIFDHFGVDDSDINRKSGALGAGIGASMASFFVLQHHSNVGGNNRRLNKYRPCRLTLRTDMGPFTAKVF